MDWRAEMERNIIFFTDAKIAEAEVEVFQSHFDPSINIWILNFGDEFHLDLSENIRFISVRDELELVKSDEELLCHSLVGEILKESKTDDSRIQYSPPYYDVLGKGEIITIGLPIYDEEENVFGALGIDTEILTRGLGTTTNLNLGSFDGRFNSYIFFTDRNGIVIYHPFKPFDQKDIAVSIFDLERNTLVRNELQRSFDEMKTENSGLVFNILQLRIIFYILYISLNFNIIILLTKLRIRCLHYFCF